MDVMRKPTALNAIVLLLLLTMAPLGGQVRADDTPTPDAPPAVTTPSSETPPSEPGEPSEPAPVLGEADPDALPSGPGTAAPAPTGSQPTDQPAPLNGEDGAVYGACANQGPVISGQLLLRLTIPTSVGDAVTNVRVEAENARVKEIEIPYHNWVTSYDGDRASATGTAVKDGFWLWVALDRVEDTAENVTVKTYATLDDGRTVALDLAAGGQPEAGRFPATVIPVTAEVLANKPKVDPNAPADAPEPSRETPLNGRIPCRIGEAELATERSVWPFAAAGVGGILLGALLTFAGNRRRRRDA